MAKGDSEFAAQGLGWQEIAGEYRRAVAGAGRGRVAGTADPDQVAPMGSPKAWTRGEPDAWRHARPVRRAGWGNVTPAKASTRPSPTQLIHAQDQGMLGRVHVQADDVADLVDELRVRGQLPGLLQVRLQPERPPDP